MTTFSQQGRLGASGTNTDGRRPLVIGVTGHRAFAASAYEAVTGQITAFFDALSRQMPHTPIVVLSSLAAGADLMVARIARARGFSLIAALPLPASEYFTHDNYTNEELVEARELLSAAEQVVIVSETLHLAHQLGEAGDESAQQAYRLAGSYVARRCDLLVALWDDEETGGESVTAMTVREKLHGTPGTVMKALGLENSDEAGYVYHIFAPRANAAARTKAPGHTTRLYATGVGDPEAATRACERFLHDLDRFNQTIVQQRYCAPPPPPATGGAGENSL